MRMFLKLGMEKDACPGCKKQDQRLVILLNAPFSPAPGACLECIVTMLRKDLAMGAQEIMKALFKS